MQTLKRKFIGDKAFYKMVLTLTLPMLIQNGITSFVSMLDNIMVGAIGTFQMSGVSIANQLHFVYNLIIFGAVAGAGIFGAQFYGDGNNEGIRYSFRYKIYSCGLFTVIAGAIFLIWGSELISLYLNGTEAENAQTLAFGMDYLYISLIGLIPFALSQIYVSTLRETGQTFIPMVAGVAAVFVNMFFNYIMIFGKMGLPVMGVAGAAWATVIARFVEAFIVIYWTHRNRKANPYIEGVYRSFKIPVKLVKDITVKGTPLILNEGLWGLGVAMLTQIYSVRGIDVVAALNINATINNVFSLIYASMGGAIAIRIGQLLGAGEILQAKDEHNKLTFFSVGVSALFGLGMAAFASVFPLMYNTTDEIRALSTLLIIATACFMPVQAYMNSAYFTIRSGGKTIIAFIFDSVFMWIISIPIAYILAHFTNLPVLWVYVTVCALDILKCIVGYIMVKSGAWAQNIVK